MNVISIPLSPDPIFDSTPRPTLHCECGRTFKTEDGLQHHRDAKHPEAVTDKTDDNYS